MSIHARRLVKSYGSQKAVNDVSFSVGRGEVVGFLGPNGAGKSTTMKMLTGFLSPDSGDIRICNIPVGADSIEVKRKLGYLPEANPLYPDMYIREYLGFIAGIHGLRDARARTEEVIGLTGLLPEAGKRIGQLSKGYRQRVGLAAALLHDPEVLILDEPTSGLDPNQIVEIRQVIQKLGRDKTVLFSSHILQEVEALCDRVIIVNKGTVVADERISDLLLRKSEHRVRVILSQPADRTVFAGLKEIDELHSDDGREWVFHTKDPEALSSSVLSAALQHALNIVSLHTEKGSLEEVFRSLTSRP
jgi:ABC-2 type transport system ATP-binding protein